MIYNDKVYVRMLGRTYYMRRNRLIMAAVILFALLAGLYSGYRLMNRSVGGQQAQTVREPGRTKTGRKRQKRMKKRA